MSKIVKKKLTNQEYLNNHNKYSIKKHLINQNILSNFGNLLSNFGKDLENKRFYVLIEIPKTRITKSLTYVYLPELTVVLFFFFAI